MHFKSFRHFFNKIIGKFKILTSEILTKRKLTTSLVLKNRAQNYIFGNRHDTSDAKGVLLSLESCKSDVPWGVAWMMTISRTDFSGPLYSYKTAI